jgi:hypothetical protein
MDSVFFGTPLFIYIQLLALTPLNLFSIILFKVFSCQSIIHLFNSIIVHIRYYGWWGGIS